VNRETDVFPTPVSQDYLKRFTGKDPYLVAKEHHNCLHQIEQMLDMRTFSNNKYKRESLTAMYVT